MGPWRKEVTEPTKKEKMIKGEGKTLLVKKKHCQKTELGEIESQTQAKEGTVKGGGGERLIFLCKGARGKCWGKNVQKKNPTTRGQCTSVVARQRA